ncbi:MAG: 1-(5-phosphoribosyl)-5-[(5-phosphoribosylamino)methylideneamino]imidazole-4-carboxamide isomerase [Clostridiales bacterium GWF2_38_85]|nr:MAG: 1-(5-phosphoribosyl)-5-[(5-phosphoribosylamino)methylideneamino]imidazole-4-carboxamide isomerase [Clostridiales bacterium GWF2_38_85]HBL84259.1 1-(5-phosphoribosyl)-5-[(5-phosphoribosylamino)methylideneamino]imidazole-4-carboxamide isomerase [Clostridiales bacterium]
MIIFPSIDMLGGRVVRLVEGDYATAHKVAADPIETAKIFESEGAEYLHLVDLDGSKSGEGTNSFITAVKAIADSTNLFMQCGGGIRSFERIDTLLSIGIKRVILGSIAAKDPDFVAEAVRKYGKAIAAGIDARNGMVATDGWTKDSGIDYIEFAKKMVSFGVDNIIFTDISRDCTLKGPNLEQLKPLLSLGVNITASGGVGNINDIHDLKSLDVYGVICGKSIYSGTLKLREAISVANA